MYNKDNVQPQNYNTGPGGSNNGELNTPPSFTAPSELPAPTQAPTAVPYDANRGIAAVPASPQPQPAQNHENWEEEVASIFRQTVQNPRQRADQLSELKRRYQQTVLGVSSVGKED